MLVPLFLFPREHAHAHPLGVSINATEDSSLTLALQGSDKSLRASFEHGSNKGKLLGVPTVALRYSIVQGPRQSFYNAYSGICRIFTRAMRSGKAPVIFEDGQQLRDYVHIADVVAANMLVLDDARANGEAFNVGTGEGTTVLAYGNLLTSRMHATVSPTIPGTYRAGDVRHTVSSIAKLSALGWRPTKGLVEIFDDYLAWLDATPDAGDYFTSAYSEMERTGIVRRVTPQHGGMEAA